MIQVVIIGSGNVALHLINEMQNSSEIDLIQVFARSKEKVASCFAKNKITSNYSELKDADVYIIAVSDNAINEVSNNLLFENKLVVHTSGSETMNGLNSKNRKGVFYPLQTFSKTKKIDFKQIPLCLETENAADYETLESLAKIISHQVYSISTEQRKCLHVAAVFVCNFVNHLYQIGNTICKENQVPFEILSPLIQETAQKILTLSPEEAQTGPAKRNDTKTIQKHLAFLQDNNYQELYKSLTKSIQNVEKL